MRFKVCKKKKNFTVGFVLIFIFIIAFLFLFPSLGYASQIDDLAFDGRQVEIGETIGLPGTSPIIIIAKIIRVILGFLGIIVLLLVLYAGWMWMSSMGQEEKIEKAKNTLKNALIGLIIIIMSFAIVTFVINKLYAGPGGGPGGGGGGGGMGSGFSAIGNGIIQSVYPEHMQEDVPRNTVIMVTFKEAINPETICVDSNNDGIFCNCAGSTCDKIKISSIMIYQSDKEEFCGGASGNDGCVEAYGISNDNKTFVFKPTSYLGSASEDIWHTVYLSTDIEKANGDDAFSSFENGFLWNFEVNTTIDLSPPQIKNVYPYPDNYWDESGEVAPAKIASGSIGLNANPQFYSIAKIGAPVSVGGSPKAIVSGSYVCQAEGIINVAVNALGSKVNVGGIDGVVSGDDISDGEASLGCGLVLKIEDGSFSAGNSWNIAVSPEKQADFLIVGSDKYVFVKEAPENFKILVGADKTATAGNIISKINEKSSVVSAKLESGKIKISAKTAGSAGNKINLKSNCDGQTACSFQIIPMSGGDDLKKVIKIKGAPDNPMNSVIQINFNEAIIPLSLVGPSDLVKNTIKVVNGSNEIIDGNFSISNQYRTIEFLSNNECGVNACGDTIYCLPENSNLKVIIKAAPLISCSGDANCALYVPFNSCKNGLCQNSSNENYPQSSLPLNSGVVDAAMNSLDGNRNEKADGPESQSKKSPYYENDRIATCRLGEAEGKICNSGNAIAVCGSLESCKYFNGDQVKAEDERISYLRANYGDDYQWSFMVNDIINLEPPIIETTFPANNISDIDLYKPINVLFNKLMMSSSLATGFKELKNGEEIVRHKLINLSTYSNKAIGYWISKNDIDENPRDGYSEKTEIFINHSEFSDLSSYWAQIGSGVRDIFQNCFKPSKGPACLGSVNDSNPSCCYGTAQADECEHN